MWLKTPQAWSPQRLVDRLSVIKKQIKEAWKLNPLTKLPDHIQIGPDDRDGAVAWLAQLNAHFRFYPDTFFQAVSILDRFLTAVKAQPKYLRCIAITCLYLASKTSEEEDVVPSTSELVVSSQCGCRVQDVLRMERIICEKLEWMITSPTALQFLHAFRALALNEMNSQSQDDTSLPPPNHHTTPEPVVKDLMQAMCSYQVAQYPSAAIALAIVSFEAEAKLKEAAKWTPIIGQLQAIVKVETSDLMKCRDTISEVLPNSNEVSTAYNSTYLVRIIPKIDAVATTPAKEIPSGVSGTSIKRKASSDKSLSKISDNSKKIHGSTGSAASRSHASAANRNHPYSADITMRVVADGCVKSSRKYRTYADILKSGIEDKSLKKAEGFSEMITTPPLIQLQQS